MHGVDTVSRRTPLTTGQRVDLNQRRRTRDARAYSEQPTPLNTRRLPNAGEGGSWDPAWPTDVSWLSADVSWMDPDWSWLG